VVLLCSINDRLVNNSLGDKTMTQIEIYTKPTCPYCYRAKRLLDAMNTDYIEYDLSSDIEKRSEMISRTHGFTVPQIIIDNQPVGGSDELFELLEKGVLAEMLKLDFPTQHPLQPQNAREVQHAA
jgi:glutaredoxin 3